MFKELQPLLENRTFVLMVAPLKDSQIQVSFIPKSTDKDTDNDKPLLQPLTITGTAEELDQELPAAIADYADSYRTIAEQVQATKEAMKTAAASTKAKPATKTATTPAKKVEPAKPATKPELKKEEAEPSLFGATEPEEVFEP